MEKEREFTIVDEVNIHQMYPDENYLWPTTERVLSQSISFYTW